MRALASMAAVVLAVGTPRPGVSASAAGLMVAQAGEWAPPTPVEGAREEGPDDEEDEAPDEAPPTRASRQQPPPQAPRQPPPQARREPPPPRQSGASQATPRQQPSPQQLSCPPPPRADAPPATAPAPQQGTISGSSICGATIIGGTISGATIIGGTISGGAISGGTISQSNVSGANEPAAATAPANPSGNAQPPAPQTAAPQSDPPAQAQPAAPARPAARTPPPPRRDGRGGSPQGRAGEKRQRPRDGSAADDDEDEEDLAARALERALVQRGALLLPIWAFELAPGFTYGHSSEDTFATVPGPSGAPTTLGVRKRIHQVTGTLAARFGLPLDLQIEAAVPASFVVSDVTVAGAASDNSSAFGLGDPRFSLTWQMIHGGDVAPDLFLAGSWKSKLGSSPFEAEGGKLGLGTGYNAIGATLTAVKSADPLVLLANVGYTENLAVQTKQGRRALGNTFGLGGGAILAVSPDTSLSFLLDFHYKPDDTLAGKAVLGSDETVAVLQLGLGRVLSRSVLLNVNAALGVTADSPNFQLGVSMPVRF